MKKILIAIVFVVFVIIQFFTIDKTNPAVDEEKDFLVITNAPSEIGLMINNSCYDCPSHHTKYPWYTNVAPVSWIINNHINDGRQHLNFSVWSEYDPGKQNHQLQELIEVVKEGKMPLKPYILLHSEAELSNEQRLKLVSWLIETQN